MDYAHTWPESNHLIESTSMYTESSFSRLFGQTLFASDDAAKAARDTAYRAAKAAGLTAKRSVLRGQLRQYWSFGVPCGEVCDVYNLMIIT